jgi:tetratricopeptide (TPR) repeat protein
LRRAVALNPGLVNARTWLSTALNDVGEKDEAIALLESIVEHDPAFPPAFQNLVQYYLETRNLDNANALVGRVERIVGETTSVAWNWGAIAFSQDEHANAIRHFRRAYEAHSSDTVLKFFYGLALRRIGEFEQILTIGIPGQVMSAYLALGDDAAAKSLFEQLRPTLRTEFALSTSVNYYTKTGDFQSLVSWVETEFGSIGAVLEQFPRLVDRGTGYMGRLAYALLQTGRDDDFEKVTAAMNSAIDSIRAAGTDFYPLWFSEAEYAALTGSDEEVLDRLRYIVDQGTVNALGFESLLFKRVADNDRYRKMDVIIRNRADSERAKLGLAPYRQIMVTHQ